MRGKRLIFSLLTTLLVFGAVELGARLLLGRPPPGAAVSRIGTCTLAPAGLECAHEPRLSVAVPPHGARPRVVFLGGSTVRMRGDANDPVDFPTWVARLWPEVEVLNLGVPGYSTAGVWQLTQALGAVSPDLVVVMTGHNDYNAALFDGQVQAASLWTVPLHQALSHSWIRAWLYPLHHLRAADPHARAVAIEDDVVARLRPAVDARFRAELERVVADSPAPMVLTTLFRNFGHPPTGVFTAGHPDCAALLERPTAPEQHDAAALDAACGLNALSSWLRARSTTAEPTRAEAWRAALALDAAPLRAPLSADDIVREVAAAHGAPLADVAREQGGYQPGRWFFDPIHTNEAGAEALARAMLPTLKGALE